MSRKDGRTISKATLAQETPTDRDLIEQARTRLRRIEGQVRGIQGMLDQMAQDPAAREEASQRIRALLSEGKAQAAIARELSISKQRVADVAKGREPAMCAEPCDGLLNQILAVHAAVEQVGLMIMELHLQHCVLEGVPIERAQWNDLRDLLKRWSRLSQG
jgi:DNA-binding FrmR family transcriptional regulator